VYIAVQDNIKNVYQRNTMRWRVLLSGPQTNYWNINEWWW